MYRAQASTHLGEVAGAQAAKPPSTCGCGASSENRLTQAHLTDGSNVAYDYDVDGNRVRTTVAGPPTNAPATACSGNGASFVRFDESTHGNWQGVYGADGNAIAQETPVQPTYGSATFAGGTPFTWAASTTDARALLVPGSTTARIASANVSFTSQTVHVATTDRNAHTVALYFLDWDSLGRTETVTAQTPGGAVLDAARPVAGFEGGMYAVYTVCGAVDFVVTSTHGGDPIHPRDGVVSGVFFGPAMAAGAQSVTGYLVDASAGLSQVVAETDGGGNLTAYYVRVGDELLEVMRPGGSGGMWTSRFVHSDGLGSVRAISDESGSVVDARGYEAFGTKNVEAGNDSLAYGFAGEPLDATTHLAYHRARWMDAKTGRFVGMDSAEADDMRPATVNRYAYVVDEPVMRIDPTGEFDLGGISAAIDIVGINATLARASKTLDFFHKNDKKCRCEVYYRPIHQPIAGLLGGEHSYVIYWDEHDQSHAFEGGPETGGDGKTYLAAYANRGAWGNSNNSPSDTNLLLGGGACVVPDTELALETAVNHVNAVHAKYNPVFGPNSNTVTRILLHYAGFYALNYYPSPGWLAYFP